MFSLCEKSKHSCKYANMRVTRPIFVKSDSILEDSSEVAEIIRVDHAGEYGAVRIYSGQLQAIIRSKNADMQKYYSQIEYMHSQEQKHLAYFKEKMVQHHVRPTALLPIWHIGGYLMGRVTGSMGIKAAMICTHAVEDVIEKHYSKQLHTLQYINDTSELSDNIKQFRLEEIEHSSNADEVVHHKFYSMKERMLKFVIGKICKCAISLSKIV